METTIDSVIIDINTSADNANTGLKNLVNTLNNLNSKIAPTISNLSNLKSSLNNTGNSINNLNIKAKNTQGLDFLANKLNKLTNLAFLIAGIRKLTNVIGSAINTSNEYIENLNLFYVSMGKNADKAKEFTDNFSKVLGVDPSNVMRYMGIFNTLAEGFGISSDKAYIMSKNLTQLSYDMSSFLNIPIEQAMQKIKSGFSGEIEPMRAVGVALDQASLQETAYTLGLKQKVSEMTRAQKSQLLYYQMITKTTTMQGDMARTLLQPANAIRVLKQQFTLLSRAIGNIFIPILTAVIPYVMVLVKWLTTLANAVAKLFGWKGIDTSSYTQGTEEIVSGIGDIEDSASGATKELKKMLAPFDELNVIDFGKDKSGGSGAGGVGGDLGIPLPGYDALTGALSQNLGDIEAKLKTILPYFIAIGTALLAWRFGSKIIGFLDGLGLLAKMGTTASSAMLGLFKIISGIALIVVGAITYFQGFADVLDKNKNLWDGLGKVLIGIGVIMAGVLIIFGGIPALITGAVLAIGALVAIIIRYWDEIKAWGLGIFNSIVEWLSPITTWINENIIQPVVKFFNDLWEAIVTPLGPLVEEIKGAFLMAWEVIQLVWEKVQPFFQKVWEGITNTFSLAWEIIKGVWKTVLPFFQGIWEGIKAVFSVVKSVLGGFFNTAWEAIKAVWNNVVNFFTIVWAGIKAVFAVVKGVLSGDFSDAWEAIKNVWDKVKIFFQGVWDGIKNVFGSVASWFKDVFSTAWQAVKNVFSTGGKVFEGIKDGIADVLKTVINAIIRGINKVISIPFNALNNILRKLKNLEILGVRPFNWIYTFSVPQIPQFEDGGFPNKGQMFIANEAGPELIGNIGRKSAVANNDQIIEGIRQGVAQGVSEAMPSQQKGPINVYIGNKKVYSGYGEYANTENNMYGSNVIRV